MNFFIFAQANPPQSPQGSLISMLPMFVIILLIFYFIVYRPQQKEQKKKQQLLESMKKGDKVVTIGGIHGIISAVKEETVLIKVYEEVKIEVNKSSVTVIEK